MTVLNDSTKEHHGSLVVAWPASAFKLVEQGVDELARLPQPVLRLPPPPDLAPDNLAVLLLYQRHLGPHLRHLVTS